jgi:hypothetical protein
MAREACVSFAEGAAIRTRFGTLWGDATPIAWGNTDFVPPDPPAPWVRLTILPATARQVTTGVVGQRRYRSAGVIIVGAFVPEDAGEGQAQALAEQACAIFRGVTAEGVRYTGPRGEAPRLQTVGNDGRGWYQVNAIIPYTCDSHH